MRRCILFGCVLGVLLTSSAGVLRADVILTSGTNYGYDFGDSGTSDGYSSYFNFFPDQAVGSGVTTLSGYDSVGPSGVFADSSYSVSASVNPSVSAVNLLYLQAYGAATSTITVSGDSNVFTDSGLSAVTTGNFTLTADTPIWITATTNTSLNWMANGYMNISETAGWIVGDTFGNYVFGYTEVSIYDGGLVAPEDRQYSVTNIVSGSLYGDSVNISTGDTAYSFAYSATLPAGDYFYYAYSGPFEFVGTDTGNASASGTATLSISTSPVPEPATLTLLGVGTVSVLGLVLRRRKPGRGLAVSV
jgi:hypothetical protein